MRIQLFRVITLQNPAGDLLRVIPVLRAPGTSLEAGRGVSLAALKPCSQWRVAE